MGLVCYNVVIVADHKYVHSQKSRINEEYNLEKLCIIGVHQLRSDACRFYHYGFAFRSDSDDFKEA